MHVLQITPRYFPNIGGVETVVQKISEMFSARGNQVTVYSIDLRNGLSRQEEVNGVLVKRFIPLVGDPLYLPEPRFFAFLRHEKADVIHIHNIHTLPPTFATFFKRSTQKLVIQPHYHRFGQTSLRHFLLKLYRNALNNLVFPFAGAVVVNSVYEQRILREDFPKCQNLFLIPEGIDLSEVKQIMHRSAKPKRILYVGTLKTYKNVDKVLEGFASLIKSGNTDFRLVIVGMGPEHDFLFKRAKDLGINAFVEWKHNLSRQELLSEYADASVLTLLSPLESFSRVVYEALLIGIPTVVLNYGATASLVSNGFAEGVNSFKPSEIAEAILKAANRSYPKLPEGPFTFLSWEAYLNKIISIYQRLL